jgi:ERF superfamily
MDNKEGVPSTLAEAMALLQQRLPEVRKTKSGQVGNQKTRYADLAEVSRQIMPLLGELGLAFSAYPTLAAGGTFVLRYELMHISGESRGGEYPLLGNTPQAHGSAITYARRYTLTAVTGVAPEDDDDAAAAQAEMQAGGRTAQRSAQRAARQAPPSGGQGRPTVTAQRAAIVGSPATPAQVGMIVRLFEQDGVMDRDIRLDICSQLVGRHLESSSTMTKDEAAKIIDCLMSMRPAQETADA